MTKIKEPWRIALNDLRVERKMSHKQIADELHLPEATISRLFNGESKKPDFLFVAQVIRSMGGSVSEILGEGGAYIVSHDVATLQAQYEELKVENERLRTENEALKHENAQLTKEILKVVHYFVEKE